MPKVLDLLKQESAKAIEEAKRRILAEKIESKRAYEALQFYVTNWDDTTHPGFLGLGCEAVGGNIERAVPMQVVMLYLAAAMDLHDDVIDGSDVKNGRPTVYGKFGKDIALLIGNAFFLKGFTLLEEYRENFQPHSFKAIVKAIEDSLVDVGNAHLLEVDLRGKTYTRPSTYLLGLEKKASIIGGLFQIGAITGQGSKSKVDALRDYGKILGTMIAVREEFIDVFEIDELRNRLECGPLPLPILYAIENPRVKSVLSILKTTSSDVATGDLTKELVDVVFEDRKVKKLVKSMRELSERALGIVGQLELQSDVGNELKLLALAMLEDL